MTRQRVLAVVGVLLVASCLRPAITSVGPLLNEIGDDTGLSESALGLLSAVPLLMFALFSPLAGRASRRGGMETAVLWTLVALAVGIAVRSVGGLPGLWAGTAIAGAAVAIANVLAPALVKRDFHKPALAMGVFTTALACSAALASGTAVPLADATGGWRPGLLAWALLPTLVIPVWLMRIAPLRRHAALAQELDNDVLRRLWRSPIAWQVTVFFGLQSATFYILVTWLPSIEGAYGISDQVAGVHLLVYQLFGAACGLGLGGVMEGRADQRLAAVFISVPVVVAMLGLALVPEYALLWVVLSAVGAGPALTVALSLLVLRTSTAAATAALSGMAQSIGYLIASAGPVGAGLLAQALGWRAVLVATAALAAGQAVLSLWAGQPGRVDEASAGVVDPDPV